MGRGEKTQFKRPGNGRKVHKIHAGSGKSNFHTGRGGGKGRRGPVNRKARKLKSAQDSGESNG